MKMLIKGTGSALPENILTNKDLEKFIDTDDEWIKERTGIEQRHVSKGETVASLSAQAVSNALENAGQKPENVELIILATCSPEMNIPCEACQVQGKIGAVNAVAFDLNAACSGFLFALNTAYAYLSAGIYKNAVVIGAEVLSKIVDWNDRGTCILFGDGAGAVYVESDSDAGKNYNFIQHANGIKGDVLTCGKREIENPIYQEDGLHKYVSMDGREIFKFAVGQIPKVIDEVLAVSEVNAEDIDLFILHQANLRIISSIAKKLGQSMDKFPTNADRVGNMSSASIPVLLDECNRNGLLKRGMKIVMSGFGAGLTYGASLIEW